MNFIRRKLSHPLTRDLEIDDPETNTLRKKIIDEKIFLRKIYFEWYQLIRAALPDCKEPVLELGSGAGFSKEVIPQVITSEILQGMSVDVIVNSLAIPLKTDSLSAIIMTDVLHHLPEVRSFFKEAARCVVKNGKVIMIEPWVSPWSNFVYQSFHTEPFEPERETWDISNTGPLSGANGALPWIIFVRDRVIFEKEFPNWKIIKVMPMMPFVYLLSGGISMRSFQPGWTYSVWRWIERWFNRFNNQLGMFVYLELHKI